MKKIDISINTCNLWIGTFVMFLVLKLTNTVSWSWAIILMPLWVPVVVFFIVIILGIISIIINERR